VIKAIQKKHLRLADDARYYERRWDYMEAAIRVSARVSDQVLRVIEIGPYQVPMFFGSTVIDKKPMLSRGAIAALAPKEIIAHDITEPDWPVPPVSGDWPSLAVALQGWEHLEGKQVQAFEELKRHATFALLSFPFEWKTADPNDCHRDVTRDIIESWTPGAKVMHEEVCAKPSPKRKRLIRLYDLR